MVTVARLEAFIRSFAIIFVFLGVKAVPIIDNFITQRPFITIALAFGLFFFAGNLARRFGK
jgi:cytochrome c biogenesis protein CcdA